MSLQWQLAFIRVSDGREGGMGEREKRDYKWKLQSFRTLIMSCYLLLDTDTNPGTVWMGTKQGYEILGGGELVGIIREADYHKYFIRKKNAPVVSQSFYEEILPRLC